MPVYKVFTWNMQRAQSVSRQGAMIRERYRVLKALVDWADFGFITEPGRERIGSSCRSRVPSGTVRGKFGHAATAESSRTKEGSLRSLQKDLSHRIGQESQNQLEQDLKGKGHEGFSWQSGYGAFSTATWGN
jgi:hypothetical protein